MSDERELFLVAGPKRFGRCEHCHARIEWGIRAPSGKFVPLNPNPLVLRVHENADTGVRFNVVAATDLHFVTCTQRPAPKSKQPRMFGGRARP